VDQFGKRGFPKILLGIGRLWTDDYGKFLAGEIIERGGRIISFQHGAGYGFSRLLRVEDYERQVNDRFYTWGWASQENDPKLSDLPNGKLVFQERQPGKSSLHSMMLLVGTGFPRYLYRFQSYPVGSQWVQYIQATKDFLEAIDPQKGKNLVYRGYGIDYGWAIPQQLQERFPQLTVDNHSHPFYRQMNKSRLVVFDHPSTTFLEAMAANIPSILFFEPRFWDARDAAQPYLNMLRLEGILHTSAQSAAQQVNRVYDHIDHWWFSAHLQEARKRFVNHFALSSNGWNRQWTEAIRRELAAMSK
jgi:putative transferase (TIGR04331 family)